LKKPSNNEPDIDQIEPTVSLVWLLIMALASVGGAAVAILVLPGWIPGMSASILGEQPKVFWYLSRSSGFVAYILLWISMIMGVGITNKAAVIWPGLPSAIELHQFFTILGVFFAVFHALILMGDAYLKPTLVQILQPFAMFQYRPISVGLGQLAFYLWIVITVSFYVRRRITNKVWRLIHYFSYLMIAIALVHGLSAGTDSSFNWASYLYWGTSILLLVMTVYRVVNARMKVAAKRQRQSPPAI
jgi:predicted ferric reductase